MKAFCLALLAFVVISATAYEYDGNVIVGTDATFNNILEEFDFSLIEFYAPWCGHCKNLAPEYSKAADILAESNPNIKLVKVDATVETGVAGRFEIGGYPTIKLFVKGNPTPIDYNGGRTASDIANYLKKKAGPASSEVSSVSAIQKAILGNDATGLFVGSTSSDAYSEYLAAATSVDDVIFYHTDSNEIKSEYGVNDNTFLLFVDAGSEKKVYTETFRAESLREFISSEKMPTVIPFTQAAAQQIFGGGLDAIFLIVADDDAGTKAAQQFRAAASEHKKAIAFSLAKIEEDFGGKLADYLGVKHTELPAVRIVRPSHNMQKFVYEDEITEAGLAKFVQSFTDNTLKPYFKSAPIPTESHEGNVRVVVGKNFDEVVLNSNADVLLELYAPWCGHCKHLVPIYEQLATQLKGVEGIVIAKMDATENEVESVHVEGFPTIRYYSRDNKRNPVDYDEGRDLESFLNYLRKHSSANIPAAGSSHSDDAAHHGHSHDHNDHHGHDHGHGHGGDL